ncbi:hypothetical protein GCM10028775_60610 [Catellatospora paridis]
MKASDTAAYAIHSRVWAGVRGSAFPPAAVPELASVDMPTASEHAAFVPRMP